MSHCKLQHSAIDNMLLNENEYIQTVNLVQYIKTLLQKYALLEISDDLSLLMLNKSKELSIFEKNIEFLNKNFYYLIPSFDEYGDIENEKVEVRNEFRNIFLLSEYYWLTKEKIRIDPRYTEKYDQVYNKLETVLNRLEINSNFLYAFDRTTYYSDLICFNIKEKAQSRKYLSYFQFEKSSVVVQLPNGNLLCAGCEFSSATWVIDTKNGKVIDEIRLKNSLYQMHPTYHKNSAYIFGGFYSISSRLPGYLAMRVDLTKKRSFNLPWLPRETIFCSSVAYKNLILLLSKDKAVLYQFDTLIDSYSEIHIANIKEICIRIIFYGNSRLYILGGSQILESEENNQYTWANIGSSQIGDFTNSSKISYKDSVYIVTQNYKGAFYYEFNLEKRQLEPIA